MFRSADSYASEGNVELLPFRFNRLLSGAYLLTNLVGEHVVTSREILEDLVSGQLNRDLPIFADLRAKHFLRFDGETTPLELLALKVRTRSARLAQFTNLHIFVVSLRCDHSCPYCQVSRQSEDRAAFDMTPEIADKALDFCFQTPNRAVKIEFQGGEPLLNFDLVKYIVLRAKEINEHEGRNLEFVIATTLSLLTDEILSFCREHKILLSSSLDGPKDLHNKNRPRPGQDSYQRFCEGLTRAREWLGFDRVGALMTTTQASLPRVREIIDEYVRLGFDGIFLRPLSPYGFAIKTKGYQSYNVSKWLDFYKEGLSYIIELNRSGVPFVEQFTAIVCSKIFTNTDPGYVDLMSPSGIGIGAVVFNYDGNVFASDESRMLAEMGDHSFRLGHLLEHTYEDVMLSDSLLDALERSFTLSAPMCSDCAFEPFCGADPVYHHATQADPVGRKPESGFCQRNMGVFEHIIDLTSNDPEVKSLFLGWASRC